MARLRLSLHNTRARLVDSRPSRNRTFSRGYPNFISLYGGLLEPIGQLKTCTVEIYVYNAENFMLRLSWAISSDFGV